MTAVTLPRIATFDLLRSRLCGRCRCYLHMISPVTNTHANTVQRASQPARLTQPQAPVQKSGTLSHDTVTLKSAGDVDGDGK